MKISEVENIIESIDEETWQWLNFLSAEEMHFIKVVLDKLVEPYGFEDREKDVEVKI